MTQELQSLIVLGTGNAMVTRCFNTCFALRFGQGYFLVDSGGGNGILRALADAGISACDIHDIFITHAHTDHILGMPWLVRSIGTQMLANRYEGMLNIYCHDVAAQAIRTICALTIQKKFTKLFDDRIRFVTLKDGDTAQILGRDVRFFDIRSTKAKQFGMQVALPQGRSLVCLGDEPCDPSAKVWPPTRIGCCARRFAFMKIATGLSPTKKITAPPETPPSWPRGWALKIWCCGILKIKRLTPAPPPTRPRPKTISAEIYLCQTTWISFGFRRLLCRVGFVLYCAKRPAALTRISDKHKAVLIRCTPAVLCWFLTGEAKKCLL